jgi:AcrR family transcriptional regulator
MPPTNKLVKLGLESKAIDLYKQKLSLSQIADTLSNESGENITKGMVFTYFKSDVRFQTELLETQTQLQTKVIEAEISTIEDREQIIRGLIRLAQTAGDERARVMAYKHATEALDSLDRRIGKLSGNPNIQINNLNAMKNFDIGALTDEQLIEIINSE